MSEIDRELLERTLDALRRRDIVNRCAEIRERADLSQLHLANILDVDRVTVTRWENGGRRPRGDDLRNLIEVLTAIEDALPPEDTS